MAFSVRVDGWRLHGDRKTPSALHITGKLHSSEITPDYLYKEENEGKTRWTLESIPNGWSDLNNKNFQPFQLFSLWFEIESLEFRRRHRLLQLQHKYFIQALNSRAFFCFSHIYHPKRALFSLFHSTRKKTSISNEKKDVQCAASSCAYVHILPFFFRGRTNKLIHFFFIFLRSVHSPDRQRRRRFVLLSRRSDSGSLWVEFFAAPSPSLIREKVCATI